MARFLLITLLAATALFAVQASRQLSHAGPSSAEVFWRTVLPDSPLPDSIHWLLHPDTESAGNGEIVNKGTARADEDSDDESLSQDYPFFYFGYRHSAPSPSVSDDEDAGSLSQDYPFFYFGYKHNSPTPASDKGAQSLSQDYPFAYFSYKHKQSSPTPADGEQVATSSHNKAAAMRTVVFFHEEAVRVGEVLPIYFPPARRSPRGLLPRNVADSIPFSTSALPDILARFGIAAGSVEAVQAERTLGMCETPSLEGEAKFCATSLEAMVEGAVAALGTRDVRPVTSALPRSGAPLQRYTVRAVRPVEGSRFVACHDDARYPFTVFMCHDTGKVRAYMAEMDGEERGNKVTVAVVCHTDTSKWDPEHMSFKMLGTTPGGEPVCHLMPYGHIMWAKNTAAAASA